MDVGLVSPSLAMRLVELSEAVRIEIMGSGVAVSRRRLMRGLMGRSAAPALRPPWATSEAQFTDKCDRCGDCLRACNKRVLVRGSGFYPELKLGAGFCTFCEACVDVCKTGALDKVSASEPWAYKAEVADNCLSLMGTTCRVCEDSCLPRAIRMRPELGGRYRPIIDVERCNGCGACLSPCPTNALSVALPAPAISSEREELHAHQA